MTPAEETRKEGIAMTAEERRQQIIADINAVAAQLNHEHEQARVRAGLPAKPLTGWKRVLIVPVVALLAPLAWLLVSALIGVAGLAVWAPVAVLIEHGLGWVVLVGLVVLALCTAYAWGKQVGQRQVGHEPEVDPKVALQVYMAALAEPTREHLDVASATLECRRSDADGGNHALEPSCSGAITSATQSPARQEAVETKPVMHTPLLLAQELYNDYVEVMHHWNGRISSEELLPGSKQAIKSAIVALARAEKAAGEVPPEVMEQFRMAYGSSRILFPAKRLRSCATSTLCYMTPRKTSPPTN